MNEQTLYINPSIERYRQLFEHEYTHVVMSDKYNRRDLNWRKFFGTKVGTADSRTYFGRQFKHVYGRPLRKVWNDWKEEEKRHQKANLDTIRKYPVTPTSPLTEEPLGSVSPFVYNPQTGKAYAAMNAPGDFAHITELDLNTGKQRKVVKKLKFQRVNNIVYDNAADCLYGNNGEHTLLLFRTENLANALFKPEKLITWEDCNLGQFRFSLDDRHLIGSSYYTGVSNLWQIDIATHETQMLSNTDIGLFAPLEIEPGKLMALQFERNGMRPVSLAREVVTDANAVQLYGHRAFEKNQKVLEEISVLKEPLPQIEFGDVYNNITPYNVLKEMQFAGAFPTISGFTDAAAWNHVTPVLGYRFIFNDPVGLSRLTMELGTSPWSNNDLKHQFHADLEWKYYFWTLKGAWNHTDFYDLAGPMRSSRKGYRASLAYDYSNTTISPYNRSWGFSIGAYGGMDALPMYQEISVDDAISSMQTESVYGKLSKTRGSLGSVMREQGYELGIQGYSYLADGKFYPSVEASGDFGVLLPVDRNTSFWLRTAAGHNFGDAETVFGNSYFGGFRNNRVDYRNAFQYRGSQAMPGAGIDAITAHSFAKATAELNLRPIRLNNFGALFFYPTWIQCSLFGTGLSTWNPGMSHKMFYSTGVQLTTELVLLNYLKTTLSVGYGHLFAPEAFPSNHHGNEWMISLKLL